MQCPNCGLISPRTAMWCDCDYEFQSSRVVLHSASLTADGNECGECGLINLFTSIWCLCGRDLRQKAVVASGPIPTARKGLTLSPYLIDGIAFWLPFAAFLAVSPALSISALLGVFLLQIAMVFHDGLVTDEHQLARIGFTCRRRGDRRDQLCAPRAGACLV